ncbi:MAG: TIGR00159 family protein [Desulfovibrionaceae bacterium]|jgi:uncharacterized protein (TIGR00159 family)|nr:TIGR00159 family protein [Desulfovibrionaceae bacterium]
MIQFPAMNITWRDVLDVGLVTVVFYRLLLLIRGTRAASVLYGLLLLLAVYFGSEFLELYTLNWLLANFLGSLFLVIIILFQADIRRALSEVGAGAFWRRRQAIVDEKLEQLCGAALSLAQKRIGALVVVERGVGLGEYVTRGVEVDARLTKELLISIFYPNTPLHDGAVIVRGDRIISAACILPLAAGPDARREFGTRHRAAMGITEDTDSVAVVVSEERGQVAVAVNGRITGSLDAARLKRVLTRLLGGK